MEAISVRQLQRTIQRHLG